MPNNDERLEVRVSSAEMQVWQQAASAAQQPMSEWIRAAARARVSPAHITLGELFEWVHARPEILTAPADWEIGLTREDEQVLARAGVSVLGEGLVLRIMHDGLRAALPRIWGVEVRWGSSNRTLGPKKPANAAVA